MRRQVFQSSLLTLFLCCFSVSFSQTAIPGIKERYEAGQEYKKEGKYNDAEAVYLEVLSIQEKAGKKGTLEYAETLHSLVEIYFKQQDFFKTDSIGQLALHIRAEKAGTASLEYAETLNELMRLRLEMHDFTDVEKNLLKVLEIKEQKVGREHPSYASTLTYLGNYYALSFRFEEALRLLTQAMQIRFKAYGEMHLDYANSLSSLGALFFLMEKYEEAKTYYQRWIDITKKIIGEDHPEYIECLLGLSVIHQLNGKYKEAVFYIEKGMALNERFLNKGNLNHASFLTNLGGIYFLLNETEHAETALTECMEISKKIVGTHHSTYINALNALTNVYTEKGLPEKAEPLFLESLELRKGVLHENANSSLANIYTSLSFFYFTLENDIEAEKFARLAIDTAEKSFGKNSLRYAMALHILGSLYENSGRYGRALACYEETLETCKEIQESNSIEYLSVLGNYILLKNKMKLADDLETERVLIEITGNYHKISGENNRRYIQSLNNLGSFYFQKQMFGKAEETYKKAIALYKDKEKQEEPLYWVLIENLALNQELSGKTEEAFSLFTSSQEAAGKQLYFRFGFLSEKERTLFWESKRAKMQIYHMFSLKHHKNYPYFPTLSYNAELLSKGLLLNTKKKIRKAASESGTGAFINEQWESHLLMDSIQVVTHLLQEKKKEVIEQIPLRNFYNVLDRVLPDRADRYTKLKTNFIELIDLHDEFSDFVQQVEELLIEIFLEDHQKDLGRIISNLRTEELSRCWTRGIRRQKVYKEKSLATVEILNKIEEKIPLPSLDEKLKKLRTSTVPKERSLWNQFSICMEEYIKAKEKFFQWQSTCYPTLVHHLYPHLESLILKKDDPELTALWKESHVLREQLTTLIEECEIETIELAEKYIWKAAEEIQPFIMDTESKEVILLWKEVMVLTDSLAMLTDRYNRQDKSMVRHIRNNAVNPGDIYQWEDIRATLNKDEVAIEFIHILEDNLLHLKTIDTIYCALLLRSDSTYPELVRLCKEKDLKQAIASSPYDGKNVYPLIWKPIEKHLKGISEVYLAPCGILNRISFPGLKRKKHYLTEEYEIHQVLSTKDIPEIKQRINAPVPDVKRAVIFGGADYGISLAELAEIDKDMEKDTRWNLTGNMLNRMDTLRGEGFDYLPGSGREAREIGEVLEKMNWQTTIRTDASATETCFKSYSSDSSPELLHISTHGFYFPQAKRRPTRKDRTVRDEEKSFFRITDDPLMRSGLAFSGINNSWNGKEVPSDTDDGILTAYEVSRMNLTNTQLVVLSACDTGLGEIREGEGVYGLQRGFRLAGVQSMIVSLWKVPDKETVELMKAFYSSWTDGTSIHTAFSNAQKAMKEKYPDQPEKWAGFILIE